MRYKDYQLVARVEARETEEQERDEETTHKGKSKDKRSKACSQELGDRVRGLEEVDTVKAFAAIMENKGVHGWFRKAMGYSSE